MSNYTISKARYLAAATICQASKDVRYYLNGVLLTDNAGAGARILATDGHRLISIRDYDGTVSGDAEPTIVAFSGEALKALRAKKNADESVSVTIGAAGVIVTVAGISYPCAVVDGQFPDCDRVIPAPEDRAGITGEFPAFNPVYLADFAKIATTLATGAVAPIRLHLSSERDSARIEYPHAPEVVGVLMPIRV